MRIVLLTTLAVLLAAPAAQAAVTVDMRIAPSETRYGRATEITGTVALDGAPVPGHQVQLEGRRYPFEGDFAVLETATTAADGTYAFERRLDRNWDLRVSAGDAVSKRARAYVYPDFTLGFRARSPRVIKVTQRYRVPRGVRLEQPTLFYVGPCRPRGRRCTARSAPLAARAELERVRPGRYRSSALVRLPAKWKGRFRYGSCFRYTVGSGMGNPRTGCPKRFRFSSG